MKPKYIKNLLTILLSGLVILFLILIIQTFGGRYDQHIPSAWLWYFIIYLPPFVIAYMAKNKNPRASISPMLFIVSILYVLSTILIIFMQPYAEIEAEKLPHETLITSLLYLLPMQLLMDFFVWREVLSSSSVDSVEPFGEPLAFISYNHHDSDIAIKVYDFLDKHGIQTIMDRNNMNAGEDIKAFIEKSILNSNVTVSLISNKSLESAWVAMETIHTFYFQHFHAQKKFIACYIDDDFFQNDFTINMIHRIDAKIKVNQDLVQAAQAKMIDTRDLNDENTRLYELRNNIDQIVGKLRASLCLDIRDASFQGSMNKLLASIKAQD
jgi:hypothetical protein